MVQLRPTVGSGAVVRINALGDAEAAEELRACCAADAWVDGILAGRPYAATDGLLATSDRLVAALDDDGLTQALAAHGRIGARPEGAGREATWSRTEQAAALTAGASVQERLAAANRAYEERFGQVFLIRAAGRSADEMLAALERRLGNDAAAERDVVVAELADIVRRRLTAWGEA
jgi:2-oxo-4-hydroxy-4-carboxy-5-ureidoimidazoline decarboxylase